MKNNNLIPQADGSAGVSILSGAMLCNHFLALKDDISIRKLLPARGSRTDCVTPSEPILRVEGYKEMTAAHCHLFRKTACAAWKGHTDVEIDLSRTTVIDCAGVGALIAIRNLTRERNGVARLMNPTSSVQQVLDLTRTGQLFEIVKTPDAGPVFSAAGHN